MLSIKLGVTVQTFNSHGRIRNLGKKVPSQQFVHSPQDFGVRLCILYIYVVQLMYETQVLIFWTVDWCSGPPLTTAQADAVNKLQ